MFWSIRHASQQQPLLHNSSRGGKLGDEEYGGGDHIENDDDDRRPTIHKLEFDEQVWSKRPYNNIPIEFIESKPIGDILDMRNATAFKYASLGVCDLCILYQKNDKKKKKNNNNNNNNNNENITKTNQNNDTNHLIGYFHWVYGHDVSSAISISAYISQLVQSQEMEEVEKNTSWLFGKPNVNHRCEKAIFCTYNFLSRYDLRVETTFPGSVRFYTIDENGVMNNTVTQSMWMETFLCSYLRYEQMINSETFRAGLPRNVRIIDPLLTYYDEEVEEMLINQAIISFPKGIHTGIVNPRRLPVDPMERRGDMDLCTTANNAFIFAMRDHFLRNCQYQQAINFFNTLMQQDEMVTIHIAEVLSQMGDQDDSEILLTDHLLRSNHNIDLLMTECLSVMSKHKMKDLYSSNKQVEATKPEFEFEYTLSLARLALQLAPSKILPWLVIADLYAMAGNVEKAISCLNVIPLPADSKFEETDKTFCFYSADINVKYAEQTSRDLKELGAVPLWFQIDHYLNNQYVYQSLPRERYVSDRLLRLRGNESIVPFLRYGANNSFHQILLDEELVVDSSRHSIQSFSTVYRQKLIRSYAYSVILEANHLVGYRELMQRCNSLFESKQEDNIVLDTLTSNPLPAVADNGDSLANTVSFSLPENAIRNEQKSRPNLSILDTSAPVFDQNTVNPINPISVVMEEYPTTSDDTYRIKLTLSENTLLQDEQIEIFPGTPIPSNEGSESPSSVTTPENVSTSTDGQVFECQPWLRELFDILKEDLEELRTWTNENTLILTSSDWFYRGMMAERLHLFEFAINAYRNSVSRGFHLKSYQRLLYFSTSQFTTPSDENIEDSFVLFDLLITFYLDGVSLMQVREEVRFHRLHPCIKQAMYALVAKYGLKRVRRVFNAEGSKCRKFKPKPIFMIHELMMECVTHKTYGCDM